MGFSFRKSIRVAPGVRVNVGRRGVSSVSAGAGGLRYTQPVRGRAGERARRLDQRITELDERVAGLDEDELARRRRINARTLRMTGWALVLIACLAIPTVGVWLALAWAVFGAWRLVASRS